MAKPVQMKKSNVLVERTFHEFTWCILKILGYAALEEGRTAVELEFTTYPLDKSVSRTRTIRVLARLVLDDPQRVAETVTALVITDPRFDLRTMVAQPNKETSSEAAWGWSEFYPDRGTLVSAIFITLQGFPLVLPVTPRT